jgi:hypothetical protein
MLNCIAIIVAMAQRLPAVKHDTNAIQVVRSQIPVHATNMTLLTLYNHSGSGSKSPAAHHVSSSKAKQLRPVKESKADMGVVSGGRWLHVEHQPG